jgi:hypothetical protein
MPAYQLTPFKQPVQLLIPGTPSYVLGSFNNRTGPTLGKVISDGGNGTTATVVVQILSGNAPLLGSLITIVGTANSAGAYNVTNAVISSVSTDMNSGISTISFLSATSQAGTPDGGQFQIPQPEVGETVFTGTSVPVNSSYSTASPDQGKVITVNVNFPTPPTTVSGVFLQAANFDIDSDYVDVSGPITTVTAGVPLAGGGSWNSGQGTTGTIQAANQLNYRFYRVRVAGVVGAGTIVARIED